MALGIGLVWAGSVFAIFLGLGFAFSKPKSIIVPSVSAFVGTVILYTQTLKTAVEVIIFNPTLKALNGQALTLFELSGMMIGLALFFIGFIAIVNGVQQFEKDGSISLSK